jgi:lipoate-protein ligase B
MDWDVMDLGRVGYAEALERQRARNLSVSRGEAREALLLVEHDPVITLSRRRGVRDHLLATEQQLRRRGIDVQETDRGGDITYHGPGQLVAYPIVRLADHGLNLGRYMRRLEDAVIRTAGAFGVTARREPGATGVWVAETEGSLAKDRDSSAGLTEQDSLAEANSPDPRTAKLCAMGVRVRKNTTMHGLALNVTTDLSHFAMIDPCGLGGRPVTSLRRRLGERCPAMDEVKRQLAEDLAASVGGRGAAG